MKQRKKASPSLFNLSPKKIKKYLISLIFTLIFSAGFVIHDQTLSTTIVDSDKPIELYANQVDNDLTNTFSLAIDEAKKDVLLIVYSLTDQKIINCLKNKSLNGVNVKVICDAKASPYVDSKLGDQVSTIRRFGPGLMHQKILVIDNQKVLIGSANMTTDSLKLHGNLVTGLYSNSFANKIHDKAETLKIEGASAPIQIETFNIGNQLIELWFLPDNQKALLRLKELIRSAKKTIKIAMFTWTRQDLAKEVITASKRGINVEVVIDNYSGKGASAKIVKMLKDSNVDVCLSQGGPLLHHKFLYVDNEILVNGSANWTKSAFTRNDDCFIVMHQLTHHQIDQMEALWNVIKRESSQPK